MTETQTLKLNGGENCGKKESQEKRRQEEEKIVG
jgi:hypothetical protein